MRKIIVTVALILFSTCAFAEQEEVGRYIVKNANVNSLFVKAKESIPQESKELLKIDTITGRVWKWVQVIDENFITHSKWYEMKDENIPSTQKTP